MHPEEPTEEREKKERERSKGERMRIRSLGQASDPHGETEK